VVVDDVDRENAVALLSAINGHDATFDAASKRITLPAPKGAETLMAAARSLDGAGVTPNDITLRRPTLDDVFLAYTGKSVEEEDGTTDGPKRRRKRRGA